MKKVYILIFILIFPFNSFSDGAEDYISFEFELETVFEFSTDFVVDQDYVSPDPDTLAFPSQNSVYANQSLNDQFDLGYLIGIKDGPNVHLLSEYKVDVKFSCITNRGKRYLVSQHLTSPISDEDSDLTLPEDIFVCRSFFVDGEGDSSKGNVKIIQTTPVSIITPQVLYESYDLIDVDLSNVFHAKYWITDNAVNPLSLDQKSGSYRTTIIFTMWEEL